MFSVITNIYNMKSKGSTLMESFTATGILKKIYWQLEIFDVCTIGDMAPGANLGLGRLGSCLGR